MGLCTAWHLVVNSYNRKNGHRGNTFYAGIWVRSSAARRSSTPHLLSYHLLRRTQQWSPLRGSRFTTLYSGWRPLEIDALQTPSSTTPWSYSKTPSHKGRELVLYWTEAMAYRGEQGKLMANWKGPYKVTEQVRPCTYCLITPQRNSHSQNMA